MSLRRLRADDAPLLAQWYADPDVARFIGGETLTPDRIAAQALVFDTVWDECGYGQSVVIESRTGQAVGRVGLHPWPAWGELELGWVLRRASQGHGLACEAARAWLEWARQSTPAPYLTAVIHPDNAVSIRLATRLGFALDRPDTTPWGPAMVYRHDL